jgi:hypothetical protein
MLLCTIPKFQILEEYCPELCLMSVSRLFFPDEHRWWKRSLFGLFGGHLIHARCSVYTERAMGRCVFESNSIRQQAVNYILTYILK